MWVVMEWVRILLVLGLAVQLAVSDTDFLFDDGLEPPTGRDDVTTNLNLSPWELFVLSELSVKLINTQCPKVDPDVTSSLLKLLSESFKQAQTPETQNEDFLPAYNHLVRCLDHVLEKGQEQGVSVNTNVNAMGSEVKVTKQEDDDDAEIEVGVEDTQSAEADWAAQDALTTTTTELPGTPDEEAPNFFSRLFNSVKNWFKNVFRSKRDIEEEQDQLQAQKRVEEIKLEQERRNALTYKRARQNFANLFHAMSNIIRKTCPKAHRPEKIFLRKALLDMTSWATLDQTETISTAAKYFRRENLLAKIQECHNAL